MKWSLQQLQKINSFPYIVETTLDLNSILNDVISTGSETDILSFNSVKVGISISKIDHVTYQFDYTIKADMLVACALTLEPVPYVMDINVSEVYSTNPTDDMFPINGNTINVDEVVWCNIIINLPIRIVHENAYEILKSRNIILGDFPEEDD